MVEHKENQLVCECEDCTEDGVLLWSFEYDFSEVIQAFEEGDPLNKMDHGYLYALVEKSEETVRLTFYLDGKKIVGELPDEILDVYKGWVDKGYVLLGKGILAIPEGYSDEFLDMVYAFRCEEFDLYTWSLITFLDSDGIVDAIEVEYFHG